MISRNRIYVALLLLLTVLLSLSIAVYDLSGTIITHDHIYSKMDNGYIFYQLQHETSPTIVDIDTFRDLLNSLKKTNIYTYYEIYEQPLDIPYDSGKYFDQNTEELTEHYERVPCVQISENVQYDFDFSMHTGRLFTVDDFNYNGNKHIPVYMGYGYSELYNVGDIFTANYLFDDYEFNIIGILNTGTTINSSLHNLNLDNYIVMPSFDAVGKVPQTDSLKIHYANKTSGTLKVAPDRLKEASDVFIRLLQSTKAGHFSWYNSSLSLSFKEIVGLELKTFHYAAFILSLFFFIIQMLIANIYVRKGCQVKRFSFVGLLKSLLFTFFATVLSTIILAFPVQALLNMQIPIIKYGTIPIIVSGIMFLLIQILMIRQQRKQ